MSPPRRCPKLERGISYPGIYVTNSYKLVSIPCTNSYKFTVGGHLVMGGNKPKSTGTRYLVQDGYQLLYCWTALFGPYGHPVCQGKTVITASAEASREGIEALQSRGGGNPTVINGLHCAARRTLKAILGRLRPDGTHKGLRAV